MRRTRVLASVLAVLAVLLVAGGALFWASGAGFKPGAGAAYQTAPDEVSAGQAARITLRLRVWGSGGPARGRYEAVSLQWRSGAGGAWQTVLPEAVHETPGELAYDFVVATPATPGGTLSYRFTFVFDGVDSSVDGLKVLRLTERQPGAPLR